ncbi:MAG: hypothetical protein HYT70_04610 [Candidatus Aenigmarchaeota archaeon]|nr:hypothetical protein [Candidatus Aenigmarchaeota archaeon]
MNAGVWRVGRQLVRTPNGIFIPYNEGLTVVQAYDAVQNDPALLEACLELVPVTVLLYGIQHDGDFYKMLRGTYQLTGSGVVDSRLLGTPNVTRGDLQYHGLRNDRPIARIEPQNGRVEKLDKTALWGVGKGSKVESENPTHPTYMYNADGNRFVGLGFGYGDAVGVNADWNPLSRAFDWGARLAKKAE